MTFPNPIRFVQAVANTIWFWLCGYDVLATEDEMDRRAAHCDFCPENVDGQCQLCTCFLSAKLSLTAEACPQNKWKKILRKRNLGHTL